MEIGMLWFDDSSRPLVEKVGRAAKHYAEKYGRQATVCLVNPKTLNGGEGSIAGVQLRAAKSVMPHHYWIGIEDEPQPDGQARRAAA